MSQMNWPFSYSKCAMCENWTSLLGLTMSNTTIIRPVMY